MNSFKSLLQDTVGQIKNANEDAADLQMREIKSWNTLIPTNLNGKPTKINTSLIWN